MKRFKFFSNMFLAICWGAIAILAWGNYFGWWYFQFTDSAFPFAVTFLSLSRLSEVIDDV